MANNNNNVFAGVAYPSAILAERACLIEYVTAGGINSEGEIANALEALDANNDPDATAWMAEAGFPTDCFRTIALEVRDALARDDW